MVCGSSCTECPPRREFANRRCTASSATRPLRRPEGAKPPSAPRGGSTSCGGDTSAGMAIRTEGHGSSWAAFARAPDGREIRASSSSLSSTLVALARRLGFPEQARVASAPKLHRVARRAKPWPYPVTVEAFLDLVSPAAPDDVVRRRDVARFMERHPGALEAVPADLAAQLKRRHYWPGQAWPSDEHERRSLERLR